MLKRFFANLDLDKVLNSVEKIADIVSGVIKATREKKRERDLAIDYPSISDDAPTT